MFSNSYYFCISIVYRKTMWYVKKLFFDLSYLMCDIDEFFLDINKLKCDIIKSLLIISKK